MRASLQSCCGSVSALDRARACKRRVGCSPEPSVARTESDRVHPASHDTVGCRSVRTELADRGDVRRHDTQLRKMNYNQGRQDETSTEVRSMFIEVGTSISGHKTFNKASQWRHSRAATGRGAERARCGVHEHRRQQEQAPPGMLTGQSKRACLIREVPTDHEAHSQSQRRQLRGVATTELRRDCSPQAEAEHRARSHPHSCPEERSNEGSRRRAQQQSSGNTDLQAQSWEGEESGAGQSSGPRTACEGAC